MNAGTIATARLGESRWLLELAGEHDLSTAGGLREELDRALGEGCSVVVDLSSATFIDSSVVRVLVHAHRSTADREGQSVTVVAPAAGTPARVLDLMGAPNVLAVVESHREARALASGSGP